MTDTTEATGRDAASRLARISLEKIIELQDPSGAYLASPTFSAYKGYAWFRDGAFTADAVSSAGEVASPNRFFDWCARAILDRAAHIEEIIAAAEAGRPLPDAEMLPARFRLDGSTGDDDWWDFQLDGYGTWLWAVVAHTERHGVDAARWGTAIDLTARYLLSSWQRPCFDWWEESTEQVHVSTLGCIAAGLGRVAESGALEVEVGSRARAATNEIRALITTSGLAEGGLAKWLGSSATDASLLALIAPLELIEATSAIGLSTIARVARDLSFEGGVHRYLLDSFYGGGQWPLLSCMLGLAYNAAGDRDSALAFLAWAVGTEGPSGSLPEQVPNHLLAPEVRDSWLEKWGPVANPLVWSHAMFLKLSIELGVFPLGSDA
ncbi:MAG TPA: glycoside hydrolase family 15 protein [Galbitalea sp.]|jgi:GH15 family glucan-1,4-alpha-glucosidase|nr:glycoside hydrolase family 15 protein [Galbitalea sp.]